MDMEPALCEDRDTRSAAGEGESHWDGSQAIMADEPAGFVHNLKSFLLIFYSWVLSLWFKMGNTRVFSVYCIFKKKKKKNICAAWPNLPILCIDFEKLNDV